MRLLTFRKKLTSLLAEEIRAYLPQFEPYTSDYQMVMYASRDLEVWVKCKRGLDSNRKIYEELENSLRYEPKAFRIFLNFWVASWLEKWRERVKLLSTKPKLPPHILERTGRAKRLYQGMEYRKELKGMVTRKLIREGELCMTEVIAEQLIIQEIAKHIRSVNKGSEHVDINPFEIFNSLAQRISRLPKEKGPLIYLNIKPYML